MNFVFEENPEKDPAFFFTTEMIETNTKDLQLTCMHLSAEA